MVLSRRKIISTGAVAGAAGVATLATKAAAAAFGNPDEPPQGSINSTNPRGIADPGPRSTAISSQFPAAFDPPATDVSDMPEFWASFNNAPRRTQNGGWARQVTQADFAISETISGVNMRLEAGAIREMHWHLAAEWAIVTYGNCRITILDPQGRPYVADLGVGDLWYFPAGYPHSLHGIGSDGAEFILAFDDGTATEFNTLLLTDWLAHTPKDILALNFGVPGDTFENIPLHDLYIFPGKQPGTLSADRAAIKSKAGDPPNPFTYSLGGGPITKRTRGGFVQIADSSNFKAATTVAAALVTVHPGGMRELHWHPNADEWQYYLKGSGQMTVFDSGPRAVTANFNPGDIGYIKRSNGHYIKNVGMSDLVFLEIFRSNSFQDISLSDWLAHTPPGLVSAHLNIIEADLAKFPRHSMGVVPV
jgi:oxalate decarboxylase